MQVNQIDHKYEMKIDLGDYQTGMAEIYILAAIADGVDVTVARRAVQDMAARNLRFAGARLQGKSAPKDNLLGLPDGFTDLLTVTKIGVSYGKKVKVGKGISNRDVSHSLWAQLFPGDDPAESAAQLWQYVFEAYDDKIAQLHLAPAKPKTAHPQPETKAEAKPAEANPPQDAPLTHPGDIRQMVLALASHYRGQAEPSNKQRYPAMMALNGAVGEACPGVVRDTFTGWILGYLFGDGSEPIIEFELEAKHFSAILRWSNRDAYKTEVKALADYLDRTHNLTNPTEKAF